MIAAAGWRSGGSARRVPPGAVPSLLHGAITVRLPRFPIRSPRNSGNSPHDSVTSVHVTEAATNLHPGPDVYDAGAAALISMSDDADVLASSPFPGCHQCPGTTVRPARSARGLVNPAAVSRPAPSEQGEMVQPRGQQDASHQHGDRISARSPHP